MTTELPHSEDNMETTNGSYTPSLDPSLLPRPLSTAHLGEGAECYTHKCLKTKYEVGPGCFTAQAAHPRR